MTAKTAAQQLLEKFSKNSVTINVAGVELTFHRDNAAYDNFINEVETHNKVTPIKDYLIAIVEPTQRDTLLEIINLPSLAPQIAAKVNEAFAPDIEISVKN